MTILLTLLATKLDLTQGPLFNANPALTFLQVIACQKNIFANSSLFDLKD
jgi:hypothetical protein